MKVDLYELAQKAGAASAGPWTWSKDGRAITDAADQLVLWSSESVEYDTTVTASIPDRAHLVANSPDVTLALVARIRDLEDALEEALDGEDAAWANRLVGVLRKGVVLP